jgi:benzoylformate decarboxylase
VDALVSAQKPALVYGAGVGGAGAVAEAVALAEKLGCAVYHAPLNARMGFPPATRCTRGCCCLPRRA